MKTTRTTLRPCVSLLLFLGAGHAFAAAAPIDIELDFAPGSHERFTERVNSAQTTDYQTVLAAYESRRKAHPDEVLSQVERCRFIETYAYSDDGVIDSSGDDLEQCRTELNSGPHAENIDVLLYGVESNWAEDGLPAAQALIPKSQQWSKQQRARLFELLTMRVQWKDAELAASYAVRAVELDPASSVLLTAVERWVKLGAKDRARRLLVDAPPAAWEKVSRTLAAKLLIDIGDPQAAAVILRGASLDEEGIEATLTLARIITSEGNFTAARELYTGTIKDKPYVALDTRIEYFDFERQHGTSATASAAYEALRDQGFRADSLARYRLGLLLAHPGAGWHWRDALGLLTLLGVVLVICLLPLIAIAPVHYRGLARQVAGRAPDLPEPGWGLRHAWYALGILLLTGYAMLYVYGVQFMEALLPWIEGIQIAPASDMSLAAMMMWSTPLALLLLIPLLRGRSIRVLLTGTWTIKRSIFVGVGTAVLFYLLTILTGIGLNSFGLLGSDTVRGMQGIYELYGVAALMLVVAVATPVLEEWVFRGVMLEAFRGRVTFWFAAVVQSLVFILLHEEWQAMPFLFVFAMMAAWLARRSGGLLAPMVMHGVNNALVALAIVGVTDIINR